MTMRTTESYKCPNGHDGIKKTMENDQPYSKMWESVSLTGMREAGEDEKGRVIYLCSVCGQRMT
jgi:hypothetical protein